MDMDMVSKRNGLTVATDAYYQHALALSSDPEVLTMS